LKRLIENIDLSNNEIELAKSLANTDIRKIVGTLREDFSDFKSECRLFEK
jgi:hypothetical protein